MAIKKYKPTTNGRRGMSTLANSEITTSTPEKSLLVSKTKTGGRKPWRQKGTGRARQGSTRAPHWYHGGWAFGNQPRNYEVKQNKKERALALKSA